ncbi:MAG TPA: spore coat U domain-containing protein [Gammaproteobacteria bacterium]|nr:spore coat U domain-containing protein [Gammaproteobacteria bacterium]
MSVRWLALLAFAQLCAGGSAEAQSLYCSAAMSNIQFGTVNGVGQGATSVTGTMNINCSSASTPYVRVCIALGAPVDMSWDPRYLAGPGAQRLAYNIYTDSGYTQIWGSAFSSAGLPRAVDLTISYGNGAASVPYYARVPVQNGALAGAYSATFTYANDAAVRAAGYYGAPPACDSAMTIVSRFEFSVSATVNPDCTVSASTLDFGQAGLGLASTPVNATGTISMTCTQGVSYSIALNAGQGSGATVALRKLTRAAGTDTLSYRLYRDSGRSQLWGNGLSGTGTVAATGAGIQTVLQHTVYGTLPAQAVPRVGQYSDVVTVTVTY